jgi:hypothetical protein
MNDWIELTAAVGHRRPSDGAPNTNPAFRPDMSASLWDEKYAIRSALKRQLPEKFGCLHHHAS